MPPNKTKEFYFGWIETDYIGGIISIKFKNWYIKQLKSILKDQFRYGRNSKEELIPQKTEVKEIFGIKVLNTINMGGLK